MTRMILSDIFKNWFLLTTASVSASQPKRERYLSHHLPGAREIYCWPAVKFKRHRYANDKSLNCETSLKSDAAIGQLFYIMLYIVAPIFRAGSSAFNTDFMFPFARTRWVTYREKEIKEVARVDFYLDDWQSRYLFIFSYVEEKSWIPL